MLAQWTAPNYHQSRPGNGPPHVYHGGDQVFTSLNADEPAYEEDHIFAYDAWNCTQEVQIDTNLVLPYALRGDPLLEQPPPNESRTCNIRFGTLHYSTLML